MHVRCCRVSSQQVRNACSRRVWSSSKVSHSHSSRSPHPLHSILPSPCPPRDVSDFPSTGDIHRIRIWRRPRVRFDPSRWVFAEKEHSIGHPSILGGSSDQNRPFRRWTHGHFALPHRLSFSPTTICLSRRRIRRSRSSGSNGDLGRGV